ncbi:PKD domain protein [anaerobic digester metagenome]
MKTDYITVSSGGSGGDAPVANFTAIPTSGDSPLNVTFTDASTGSPTSWAWDFENDGTIDSTERNATFTYTTASTYTVNLTVANEAGSNTTVKTDYITVSSGGSGGDAPVANFTANVTSGDAPLAVAFTDLSTNTPTSWAWDFENDGITDSTEQNPVHIYNTVGTYTVNLTVTNDAGSDSAVKTDYIVVSEPQSPQPASIVVTPPTAELLVGATQAFAATVYDTDGGAMDDVTVAWTSSNGTVGTLNTAGLFTAHAPGTTTVTAAYANVAGTATVTVTRPQGDQTQDTSLDIPGCNVTPTGNGTTEVVINTTATNATVSGNTIRIAEGNFTLTIETEGAPTVGNGTVNGTVAGITLDTQPVVTELGAVGTVSASVSANLTGIPQGAGLTTTVSQNVSADAQSAFQLAATADGLALGDVAYTLNIVRTNLTNGQDIAGATIRMAVSPVWVDAHGGVDAIRIIRSAEDGTKEVLATTLVGTDADGNMVFEAYSPNGLSVFGLAAATAAPQANGSSSSGSGSGGSSGTVTSVGAASNLKSGESVTLAMDATAVSAVTLTANGTVKDLMVTVAKGTLPQGAEPPAGTVYQYVQATLYKAAEADLAAVQFRFAVPAVWLAAQGCTAEQVTLFRYVDGAWQAVPVEALGEENGNAVFSAAADGFGLLAITATDQVPGTAGEATLQPTAAATPAATVAAHAAGSTPTPQATPFPVWAAILAFGFLLFVRRT